MKRRTFLQYPLIAASTTAGAKPNLPHAEYFRHYIEQFNRDDPEDVAGPGAGPITTFCRTSNDGTLGRKSARRPKRN